MDKSFVSMEKKLCVVCGHKYETNSLLMDKRMIDSMERYTVTGWGMCPEHQDSKDKGLIALIGCDPEKSDITDGYIQMGGASRTGTIGFMKADVFTKVFSSPAPKQGFIFCDDALIDRLLETQEGKKE